MAKLCLTNEIASYLKDVRLKTKISAKAMAEHINKSPAYITKMEKGEIQSIDLDLLFSYLSMCYGNDETKIAESLDYIYQTFKVSVYSSEEEKQNREAYENFDKVKRKIPLSDEFKTDILYRIEQSGFDLKQIVDKINKNDDVPELKNRTDVKPNTWYCYNGVSSILLKFDYDDIYNILNSPNTSCNYITVQAILYTIGRLNGLAPPQAMADAYQTMTKFKFYSVSERHKFLNQDEYSTKEDIENVKKIKHLLSILTALSDQNVSLTNNQIDKIINNLQMDIGFAFTFMSLDLSKLKNSTRGTKKEFLLEVKKLIDNYAEKSDIDMFEDVQN